MSYRNDFVESFKMTFNTHDLDSSTSLGADVGKKKAKHHTRKFSTMWKKIIALGSIKPVLYLC